MLKVVLANWKTLFSILDLEVLCLNRIFSVSRIMLIKTQMLSKLSLFFEFMEGVREKLSFTIKIHT